MLLQEAEESVQGSSKLLSADAALLKASTELLHALRLLAKSQLAKENSLMDMIAGSTRNLPGSSEATDSASAGQDEGAARVQMLREQMLAREQVQTSTLAEDICTSNLGSMCKHLIGKISQ